MLFCVIILVLLSYLCSLFLCLGAAGPCLELQHIGKLGSGCSLAHRRQQAHRSGSTQGTSSRLASAPPASTYFFQFVSQAPAEASDHTKLPKLMKQGDRLPREL